MQSSGGTRREEAKACLRFKRSLKEQGHGHSPSSQADVGYSPSVASTNPRGSLQNSRITR